MPEAEERGEFGRRKNLMGANVLLLCDATRNPGKHAIQFIV